MKKQNVETPKKLSSEAIEEALKGLKRPKQIKHFSDVLKLSEELESVLPDVPDSFDLVAKHFKIEASKLNVSSKMKKLFAEGEKQKFHIIANNIRKNPQLDIVGLANKVNQKMGTTPNKLDYYEEPFSWLLFWVEVLDLYEVVQPKVGIDLKALTLFLKLEANKGSK